MREARILVAQGLAHISHSADDQDIHNKLPNESLSPAQEGKYKKRDRLSTTAAKIAGVLPVQNEVVFDELKEYKLYMTPAF